MNIRQKTLAALLVLGIGVSGCNTNDNNPTSPTVDKKTDDRNKTIDNNKTVDQNNTEENRTAIILSEIGNQHSDHNSTITVAQLHEITPALENINADYENIYQTYIASRDSNFSSPATRDEVQSMIDEVNRLVSASEATCTLIATQHSNGSSNITVAQLKAINLLENIQDNNEKFYQSYIEGSDTHFSSPATIEELQSMIDEVNRLVPVSDATLADIATQHSNGSSDITVAKLKAITPALDNIEEVNEKWYQSYIEGDTHFSSPATIEEVQHMIDEVNSFNLPDNAILDKTFTKRHITSLNIDLSIFQ